MRKIPTRLRGTNICTSSARFAPSFVSQPNGRNAPKLYEMHQNMSLKSKRLYRVCSFRKISMQLRGMKCTKIVRNAPKHDFRVQWGGTGAFIAKNSDAASWHELLHQFGPFCIEFCKSTKRSQMHQNFMKCTKTFFRVEWGGSGAFVAKNSNATSWHELLHQLIRFALSVVCLLYTSDAADD